jgi:CheY-like chemotaxis protein
MRLMRSATEAPEQQSSRQLQILLVDDDLMVLYSLRNILEQEGHVVTTALSGQEGIDAFKAALVQGTPFSVVITDLGMPEVDGCKVAASIKAASVQTPVILLTGWGDSLQAQHVMPRYVDRMLGKPPRLAELRAALAFTSTG